jgi:hypothetical protein
MEEKTCNKCGRTLPVTKFRLCCDSYTGEKKWRRKTCNACEYRQRSLRKTTRQFTQRTHERIIQKENTYER